MFHGGYFRSYSDLFMDFGNRYFQNVDLERKPAGPHGAPAWARGLLLIAAGLLTAPKAGPDGPAAGVALL